MRNHVDCLIVGAGPFGLSMAAYAKHHNWDYLVIGKPMSFWKAHMPADMLLRSDCDWHLDPQECHTIESYLQTRGLQRNEVEPLSLEFYLGYADWFQQQIRIEILDAQITRLDRVVQNDQRFVATLRDGATVSANKVLLALGFRYFKNVPAELAAMIPAQNLSHTCDLVNFETLRGKKCLIIGGRQSAFEWAALISEHGADEVHVAHRHATPEFTESDWSWVTQMVDSIVECPTWYRDLSQQEKEDIGHRFWAEGRLKLEPWLWPRINRDHITIWPRSRVVSCEHLRTGHLQIALDHGAAIEVDHVVLATGYKVDMRRVPFLYTGNLLSEMALYNGFPVLDGHFQSSIPGLFVTSMPATNDFGPFFAFTVSVKASAKIIGSYLMKMPHN